MGRRKWKHYQDQVTRNQFNIAEQQPISITQDTEEDSQKSEHYKPILNHRFEQPNSNSNNKNNQGLLQFERDFGKLREIMLDISSITFFSLSLSLPADKQQTSQEHDSSATSRSSGSPSPPPPEPNDWIPSDKCNFCINGRLLTVNAQGVLVAERTTATTTHSCSTSNSHIYSGIAVQQVRGGLLHSFIPLPLSNETLYYLLLNATFPCSTTATATRAHRCTIAAETTTAATTRIRSIEQHATPPSPQQLPLNCTSC